jgi:hypothetical protein
MYFGDVRVVEAFDPVEGLMVTRGFYVAPANAP